MASSTNRLKELYALSKDELVLMLLKYENGKKHHDEKANEDDNDDDTQLNPPYTELDVDHLVAVHIGYNSFAASSLQCHQSPECTRVVGDWWDVWESYTVKKNLTALLLNAANDATVAIGYEAEQLYATGREENEDWRYFHNFHLGKDEILSADGKTSRSAHFLTVKLLQGIMQYVLKSHINHLNDLAGLDHTNKDKVYWVLLIPTFFDKVSVSMISLCARESEMQYFNVVSEPVCAACHILNHQDTALNIKQTRNFIVLDCGKTSTTATYVEVSSGIKRVTELGVRDSIERGFSQVPDKFITLLNELLPGEILTTMNSEQWKKQRTHFIQSIVGLHLSAFDYSPMWNVEFEFQLNRQIHNMYRRRRRKDPQKAYKTLKDTIKSFKIPNLEYNEEDKESKEHHISGVFDLGKSNNIKITKAGWLWLFEDATADIVKFLAKFCAKVTECDIILCGGFTNNPFLTGRLIKEFPAKTFYASSQPHIAAMRGAFYWDNWSNGIVDADNDDMHRRYPSGLIWDDESSSDECDDMNALLITLSDSDDSDDDPHNRCYKINEIKQYTPTHVAIRDAVKEKQMNIDNEMNVHMKRLQEWNKSDDANNYDDDDSKQTTIELLKVYTNCMQTLNTQQARSQDISEFVVLLSKSKKEIKHMLKQYNDDQQKLQQKYDILCTSSANLKSEREHLHEKITNMVNNMNNIIEKENEVTMNKGQQLQELNIVKMERETYDTLWEKCKTLTKKYKEFENNVDENTEKLHEYFLQKWSKHEASWKEWNVDDIICWIKYLMHENKIKLSDRVKLEEVEREMKTSEFKGTSLSKIDKSDLKCFGIVVFDDYHQLYQQIRDLIQRYPDINDGQNEDLNDDEIEGNVMITAQSVSIPREFLCPISDKIMLDPVIYDGVTYDRKNLMQYVEKHGIVPGSDESYDEDEDIFKNSKLKQKIDAFLTAHPQFQHEGW